MTLPPKILPRCSTRCGAYCAPPAPVNTTVVSTACSYLAKPLPGQQRVGLVDPCREAAANQEHISLLNGQFTPVHQWLPTTPGELLHLDGAGPAYPSHLQPLI